MTTIFKSAKINDPGGSFHEQIVDLIITDGIITAIGSSLPTPEQAQCIAQNDLHLSVGWWDSSVVFGEPGYEDAETIVNGLQTAAASGFTEVMVQPLTYPVADNQAVIQLIRQKAVGQPTSVYPIGALTLGSEGTALAELYDMQQAGAIAFGDYKKNMSNANLMKIALQYVQDFDGLVMAFCQDEKIKGNGVVNEGITATRLGLKGIPNLAEEIMVARNLFLLEYTGGRLHIPTVSTAKSVELIREAKAKGLRVSCSVAVHHLVANDSVLETFNSNVKVSPPLRSETDRLALLAGVLDHTIDCITSDHHPVDIEHKLLEFDLAQNGSIGLEAAFGALLTVLPLNSCIEKLTAGRQLFGQPKAKIEVGAKANLTAFTTQDEWTFEKVNIRSKSKNAALLGQKMKGKVIGTYHNNQFTAANHERTNY
ncbi:MAG: Dihydroorotase [Bacteroidota bacterium]